MKKTFSIEVDCPLCAEKCQRAIAALADVHDCQINYILQKLTLDADDENFDEIMRAAVCAAKKAEPDFEMEV